MTFNDTTATGGGQWDPCFNSGYRCELPCHVRLTNNGQVAELHDAVPMGHGSWGPGVKCFGSHFLRMLRYDNLNDPYFSKHKAGWWKRRSLRKAKTFLKPLAYYKKKDDQSEYTLVYVNIMSGITHQIRITMQSLGHPLVSDDRYLPREQAIADCQWCPRNFLCEVRQDWFDMNGPYKNPERRRFSRISVENPLPKLFQDILEKKLVLQQKLDTTADLYGGFQCCISHRVIFI